MAITVEQAGFGANGGRAGSQATRAVFPSRMQRLGFVTALAAGLVSHEAHAATINVPAGQSIQAAINSAQNGDVIVLGQGTHNQRFDFIGKSITVRSGNPENDTTVANTIVNGGALGPVVTFQSSENANALLYGITIRNGAGRLDAGFLAGAGIFVRNASPTIWRCVITANNAQAGAGIYVSGGAPLIERNFIHHNTASHSGGGLKIIANSLAEVRTNLITGNRSNTQGGAGIDVFDCLNINVSPVIRHNVIVGNYAVNKGSAVSCSAGSPKVFNNIFSLNRGAGAGGGALFSDGGGSPYWCYNDTFNNIPTNYGMGVILCASGSISANPIFVSAGFWNDINGTPGNLADDLWVDGDYRLSAGSPCIDSGVWLPPLSPWSNPIDYAGGVRLRDDRCAPNIGPTVSLPVDMGAYEYLDALTGTTITYVGPLNGNWFTAANWNPAVVPGCSSTAWMTWQTLSMQIPAPPTGGNALVDLLRIGGGPSPSPGSNPTLTLQTGASLTANVIAVGDERSQGTLRQVGGTVHVADKLQASVAGLGGGPILRGTYELQGGTLFASNAHLGFQGDGRILQTAGSCVITDQLLLGQLNFGGPATAGGRYDLLGGSLDTQVTAIGGSLVSHVSQFNGTGTMVVSGSAATWLNRGRLYLGGHEANGTLTIQSGATATVQGGILLPELEGTGNVTVTGTGSLLTTTDISVAEGDIFPSGTLNVLAGGRVDCSSVVNGGACGSSTTGVIAATIRVDGAGTVLGCSGPIISGGHRTETSIVMGTKPRVEVSNGAQLGASTFTNLPNGDLRGRSGTINADVVNLGDIRPGIFSDNLPFGSLTINGDLTQNGLFQSECGVATLQQRSGRTIIEIGGTAPGVSYDQLHITGQLQGGGELQVNLVNGFDPPLGSQFTIGTYGQLLQPFALVNATPMTGGRFLRITYVPNALAGGGGNIVASVVSVTELIGFSPPQAFSLGGLPTDLAIADFDNEDGPDVAVTVPAPTPNTTPGDVFILLNNGTTGGTWLGFTVAAQIAVGRNPRSIATGDFDALHGPDLVVANLADDDITILRNNGQLEGGASFTRTDISTPDQPNAVGSGDLNDDGLDDVLYGNIGAFNSSTGQITTNGTVSYLAATGGGAFAAPVVRPAGVRPTVIDPADVDNDRDLDVIALSTLPQNTGPNTYVERGNLTTFENTNASGDLGTALFYTVNGDAIGLARGDLDNDTLEDVIVGNTTDDGITYFRNADDGEFEGGVLAPLTGEPLSVAAVDLDADGDLDLAAAVIVGGVAEVQVLPNLIDGGGSNALQFGAPIVPGDTEGATLVDKADVDEDKSADLVVITDDTGAFALAGAGAGGGGEGGGIAGAGGPEGAPASARVLLNTLEACIGDTNNSGTVDVDDLVTVILAWGACPAPPVPCPADIDDSGAVNVDDLIAVILHWGACP